MTFLEGYKGASVARMEESKHRDKLHGQLTSLEKLLSKTIHHISDCFNDTVSYKVSIMNLCLYTIH